MRDMQKSSPYHPVIELVFLVIMAVLGAIVFSFLGVITWFIIDREASLALLVNNNMSTMNLNFMKILQIFSSTGAFIAGPIAFSYFNQTQPKSYFYFDQPLRWSLILFVLCLMLFSNPLFDLINTLNQKMSLPGFLKELEVWMKEKEIQAAEVTRQFLSMKTYGDLMLNLFMIAVIPAIGEELFFRGGVQNIFKDWFKNHHIAIWTTAILFSAIHLQFYGFFPRMLLGAFFGYLLVYGKSIWLPILGHFLNNGTAVIMAFMLQEEGKSIDELDQPSNYPYYSYAVSSIITLVLLIMFFRQAKKEKSIVRYE
jgi:membrane protease YdiL (CAAX protease family)